MIDIKTQVQNYIDMLLTRNVPFKVDITEMGNKMIIHKDNNGINIAVYFDSHDKFDGQEAKIEY